MKYDFFKSSKTCNKNNQEVNSPFKTILAYFKAALEMIYAKGTVPSEQSGVIFIRFQSSKWTK